jgi:hypothetical protein
MVVMSSVFLTKKKLITRFEFPFCYISSQCHAFMPRWYLFLYSGLKILLEIIFAVTYGTAWIFSTLPLCGMYIELRGMNCCLYS